MDAEHHGQQPNEIAEAVKVQGIKLDQPRREYLATVTVGILKVATKRLDRNVSHPSGYSSDPKEGHMQPTNRGGDRKKDAQESTLFCDIRDMLAESRPPLAKEAWKSKAYGPKCPYCNSRGTVSGIPCRCTLPLSERIQPYHSIR